jgi:UDP-N-acetylglucosamine 2-epimerase (non-hydrolysing)
MQKKILIVVGTRPNFIKVTQFKACAKLYPDLDVRIVHTGQHYDTRMADVFFEQFNLVPDYFLNIGGGTPNNQMAEIMLGLEKVISEYKPGLLMVVGDVNSTLAAAITANKCGVLLAHLESGLRSNDRTMPEEINRVLTDEITDYFFITEPSGYKNLLAENKKETNMFFVGNTMIDTMVAYEKEIGHSNVLAQLNVRDEQFVLVTIHRPATVDALPELQKLLALLQDISAKYAIVFPVHPRTINNLKKFGLYESFSAIEGLRITEPLDYFSFQKLIAACKFILTDSGGIQEESTFKLKPCLTLRPNTERPSTTDVGTNTLLPFDPEKIREQLTLIETGKYKKGSVPDLWDGRATERICMIINDKLPF